ncbi:MAG: hypothetical protein EKK37_12900 [Sphingobacteriales bacterium]|nr:MAG: hypothetical protein EKK37_12900 [Sphingobacteriales bacterium]
MPNQPLAKAALLMLVIVVVAVTSWEIHLRNQGFDTTYYDDPALWAHKRKMVYEPSDKATVFSGSSRIKFDTDIDTWESVTGEHAIQLACVGSTPLPVLDNLANDEKFKGKLIVDVVEGLFFSIHGADDRPVRNIKYYKEETPAQWASFHINHLLESQLVFLDKEWNSLGAKLDELPLKDRPGVQNFKGFPSDFGRVKFSRQEFMTDKMAADTSISNKVIAIWQMFGRANTTPPITGKPLDSLFAAIKTSVDKIKARGGKVIFVRPPSSGGYRAAERKFFPREAYWDKLLAATSIEGIHYEDYPVLAKLTCPEESHLKQSDAKVFTSELIKILKEKGWFNTSATK